MQGTGRLPTMRPFDFSAVLLAASSGASIDVENIAAAANLPTVPPTLPGVGKRTGAAAPLAVAVGADGFDDVNDFWAQAVKPHTPALPNPAAAAARRRGPLAVATPAIAAARAAAQAEVDALARRLPTPGRSVQDDGPASPSFLPSPLPHEGVSPSAEVPSPPSLGGSPDVDDVDVDGDGSDVPTPEPSEEPLDSEAEEARRLEEEEEERRKDAEGVSSDEEGNRSADHAEEPSSAVSPSADSVATGESKAPEVDSDDGSVGAGAGAGAGAPAGDTSSQDAHGRGRGRPSITNKAAAEAGARQGKRRSARRRWAPLKYWAGERVVYRHKQGALFAEKLGVLTPLLNKKRARRKESSAGNSKRTRMPASSQSPLQLPKGVVDASTRVVRFKENGKTQQMKLVQRHTEQSQEAKAYTSSQDPDAPPARSVVAFGQEGDPVMTGSLHFAPGETFGPDFSSTHTTVYVVTECQPNGLIGHIGIRDTDHTLDFPLKPGDQFYVPTNTRHWLKNYSTLPASLTYVVVRREYSATGAGAGAGAGKAAQAEAKRGGSVGSGAGVLGRRPSPVAAAPSAVPRRASKDTAKNLRFSPAAEAK